MPKEIATTGCLAIRHDPVNCRAITAVAYYGPKCPDREQNIQIRTYTVNMDRSMSVQTAAAMALARFAELMTTQRFRYFSLDTRTSRSKRLPEKFHTEYKRVNKPIVSVDTTMPLTDNDPVCTAACKAVGIIPQQNSESPNPGDFGPAFWCQHCHSTQASKTFKPAHDDKTDSWTATCPCCEKIASGSQESIMATIHRQLQYQNK